MVVERAGRCSSKNQGLSRVENGKPTRRQQENGQPAVQHDRNESGMAPAQRGRDRLRALSHPDCSVLRTRKPLLELLLSRRYLGLGGLAHYSKDALRSLLYLRNLRTDRQYLDHQ